MTPADIIRILKTKSDNHHIINRYVKFVLACHRANINTTKGTYTEDHHICPKAKSLFPQYCDFEQHPWNRAILTARQHIISHVMLWKIFGGSQAIALGWMLSIQRFGAVTPSNVPNCSAVRYYEQVRVEANLVRSANLSGKMRYCDDTMNYVGWFNIDDPIIDKLGLVPQVTSAVIECAKNNQKLAAAALVGTTIYNNGKAEARFSAPPNDPQWVLGRLPRSDSHSANQKAAARAATLDHRFYNDGTRTIKVHLNDTPPPGFVPGMVKSTISLTDGIEEYIANPDTTLSVLSNPEIVARIRSITHIDGKVIHKRMGIKYLRNNALNLVFEVYSRTKSMPEHWGLTERLYLMERDITDPPKCEVCGGYAKPNTTKSTPSIVCSAQCANRHPSKSEITKRSWISRRQIRDELTMV